MPTMRTTLIIVVALGLCCLTGCGRTNGEAKHEDRITDTLVSADGSTICIGLDLISKSTANTTPKVVVIQGSRRRVFCLGEGYYPVAGGLAIDGKGTKLFGVTTRLPGREQSVWEMDLNSGQAVCIGRISQDASVSFVKPLAEYHGNLLLRRIYSRSTRSTGSMVYDVALWSASGGIRRVSTPLTIPLDVSQVVPGRTPFEVDERRSVVRAVLGNRVVEWPLAQTAESNGHWKPTMRFKETPLSVKYGADDVIAALFRMGARAPSTAPLDRITVYHKGREISSYTGRFGHFAFSQRGDALALLQYDGAGSVHPCIYSVGTPATVAANAVHTKGAITTLCWLGDSAVFFATDFACYVWNRNQSNVSVLFDVGLGK